MCISGKLVAVATFLQLCWNWLTLLLLWSPTSADLPNWTARCRLCPNTAAVPAGTASQEGSTRPEEGGSTILPCLRPCHNRVRPHQGPDGQTTGEAVGIKIEDSNKWKAMIQAAPKAEAVI